MNKDLFFNLVKTIKEQKKQIRVAGLWGSSRAYILSNLYQEIKRPMLIITSSLEEAIKLCEDLLFLSNLSFIPNSSPLENDVHLFPPWEILPYEPLSPYIDISSDRLKTLDKLLNGENIIVITTVEALMKRLIPKEILGATTEYFEVGEVIERQKIVNILIQGGYKKVNLVDNKGEFSIRGSIIDIFPPSTENPVRIEFLGDEIESIREFDVGTQKSVGQLNNILILPTREIILTEEIIKQGIAHLKKRKNENLSHQKLNLLIEDLNQLNYFPGIEQYLSFFYAHLETLFDYLPKDTIIVMDEPSTINNIVGEFNNTIEERFQSSTLKTEFKVDKSADYLSPQRLDALLNEKQSIYLGSLAFADRGEKIKDVFEFETKSIQSSWIKAQGMITSSGQLGFFVEQIKHWAKTNRVVLACHNLGQAQRLKEILQEYEIGAVIKDKNPDFNISKGDILSGIAITVGSLSSGFQMPSYQLIIITEDEIFGEKVKRRHHKKYKSGYFISDFSDLQPNDYIVHIDYGIGKYLGLFKLTVDNKEGDFLLIKYEMGDKLYVPVDKLNLVQKYNGIEGSRPKLDKLGGTNWLKNKQKAKEAIKRMTEALLKLYAERQTSKGYIFSADTPWQREFESAFEYEETPDQLYAIESIKKDLEAPKPMDRLVCGDVGYGKTEVAMRAAFKVVMEGKQAAVLVPTTILAQQHLQTFKGRFSTYPVNIEMLSRFRTPREQKIIIQNLKNGTVDIIIGTHRLLQKDIEFKDLGLIIVDEEQRFGVSHKEKLKQLRKLVDALTLTATPIPRTLHMSLMNIRDLSIIDTPPDDRLPIQTIVTKFDDKVIKEAIIRELKREGQIFFVHNRVDSIASIANHLQSLVPYARIVVAHGQMAERTLEKVMLKFVAKEYDILVCTTIIESGLDIPTANTIIINRADRFGLAELHQLRGRIGRAKHRAYAYLLTPDNTVLSEIACKRLKVIEDLSDLGAGFKLAAYDLEIRGSGNILGHEQSGQMAVLGLDLYLQLIEKTARELKGEIIEEEIEPSINLGIEAYLPEDYIFDPNQRLVMYKKLASAEDFDELLVLEGELTDRYGTMTKSVINLIKGIQLKILAKKLRLNKIEVRSGKWQLTFDKTTKITSEKIFSLLQKDKKTSLISEYTLAISSPELDFDTAFEKIKKVLQELL